MTSAVADTIDTLLNALVHSPGSAPGAELRLFEHLMDKPYNSKSQ